MGNLSLAGDVAPWLVHGNRVLHLEAKPVVNLETKNDDQTDVGALYRSRMNEGLPARRLYLCLGMPGEVETVGLTGHRQGEGQSVMVHHAVSHIVQLCI